MPGRCGTPGGIACALSLDARARRVCWALMAAETARKQGGWLEPTRRDLVGSGYCVYSKRSHCVSIVGSGTEEWYSQIRSQGEAAIRWGKRRENNRQGKLMNVALDSGTITVATATIDLRVVSLRIGNLWSESGCPRRCWRRRRNRGTGGS